MRLRKVSTGSSWNQIFQTQRDREEERRVMDEDILGNVDEVATSTNKGALSPRPKLLKKFQPDVEEDMNTTYSLADVSLTRSGLKRKREEEKVKEKESRRRGSPRMRKPLLI